MENKEIFLDEINGFLEEKNFKKIAQVLCEMQPVDIAESMPMFSLKERAVLFRLLTKDLAAEVFVELDTDTQEELISSFTETELNQVFKELFIDDTVDIIEEMPASVVRRILKNCPNDMRNEINSLLAFSDNTAGNLFARITGRLGME